MYPRDRIASLCFVTRQACGELAIQLNQQHAPIPLSFHRTLNTYPPLSSPGGPKVTRIMDCKNLAHLNGEIPDSLKHYLQAYVPTYKIDPSQSPMENSRCYKRFLSSSASSSSNSCSSSSDNFRRQKVYTIQYKSYASSKPIARPPKGWDDLGAGGAAIQGRWSWGDEQKSLVEESVMARKKLIGGKDNVLVVGLKLGVLALLSWVGVLLVGITFTSLPLGIGRGLASLCYVSVQAQHDPFALVAGVVALYLTSYWYSKYATTSTNAHSDSNIARIMRWVGDVRLPMKDVALPLVTWFGVLPLLVGILYEVIITNAKGHSFFSLFARNYCHDYILGTFVLNGGGLFLYYGGTQALMEGIQWLWAPVDEEELAMLNGNVMNGIGPNRERNIAQQAVAPPNNGGGGAAAPPPRRGGLGRRLRGAANAAAAAGGDARVRHKYPEVGREKRGVKIRARVFYEAVQGAVNFEEVGNVRDLGDFVWPVWQGVKELVFYPLFAMCYWKISELLVSWPFALDHHYGFKGVIYMVLAFQGFGGVRKICLLVVPVKVRHWFSEGGIEAPWVGAFFGGGGGLDRLETMAMEEIYCVGKELVDDGSHAVVVPVPPVFPSSDYLVEEVVEGGVRRRKGGDRTENEVEPIEVEFKEE